MLSSWGNYHDEQSDNAHDKGAYRYKIAGEKLAYGSAATNAHE
jgi:hypothetical protein